MNQWYKSGFTKGILILAAHIAAVLVAISLVWLLMYPSVTGDIFTRNPAKKFEDSAGFEHQIKMSSQEIMRGLQVKEMVETDGKFNPELIVDIKQYEDSTTISNENISGLAYRLGDLRKWGEGDTYEDGQTEIIVCKRNDGTFQYFTYGEFENIIARGDLQFVLANDNEDEGGMSSNDILAVLKDGNLYQGENEAYNFKGVQNAEGKIEYIDCWNYDGTTVEGGKEFAPIGAKNILEIVNNNPQWNGKLNEVYENINSTLSCLLDDINTYEYLNTVWVEGDTNLAYIFVDESAKRIYTNRQEYEDYNNVNANIEKLCATGKYVIVKPKLSDFQSNMEIAVAEEWRSEIKLLASSDSGFQFAVAVDTSYPIRDSFYTQNATYEKYGAKMQTVGITGMAALVAFIICLAWLTAVAGRSNRDELLRLNRFDRWKTEIAVVIVGVLWFFPILTMAETGYLGMSTMYSGNVIPSVIVAGVAGAFSCALFLIGYLSLVRRIKGRTLWNNSIVRALLQFIKTMFVNMHLVWKSALIFIGFAAIHWIALAAYGSGLWTMLMLIAEFGVFIYLMRFAIGRQRLREGIERISAGEVNYKIPLSGLRGEQLMLAERVNSIGEGLDAALEESMKSERLKTDLITNVSHDIKTPLTSIINYIDLLKQEDFQDPKVQRYLEVLEAKAQRLKTLTEDVVEASKVSSGNIALEFMNINLVEMIQQTSGEFEEKLKARNLSEVLSLPEEELVIKADGRRMWRVLENIYNNAAKYAMEGSRIYADLSATDTKITFNLKNVSQHSLNITADELTERFIRGDVSRSTEGSGLGLSIAKSLTIMQGGTFDLYLDGDLFKVTISFPRIRKEEV